MSDLALTMCKNVCPECPFSKNSAPGWLGPHTVDEIRQTMGMEALFGCHMQRTGDEEMNKKAIENGLLSICRGFVISAAKSCKQFGGNWDTGPELRRLQLTLDVEAEEFADVMDIMEFQEHHEEKNLTLSGI